MSPAHPIMHEAALRGGAPDPPARPGCFLAGAGLIALLALRTTPGVFPAAALFLAGVLLHVLAVPRARRLNPDRVAALLPGGIGLVLAPGLPGILGVTPSWMIPVWVGLYGAAGVAVWRVVRGGLLRAARLERVAGLPLEDLSAAAAEPASLAGPIPGPAETLLLAAERLAAAEMPEPAERLLAGLPARLRAAERHRRLLLESRIAFMRGDPETARDLADRLLNGPVDLEEGRQARAWLAYLAIAAGCPETAVQLADAAVGPHAIAGEAWFEHCRTLQVWALVEQGDTEAALSTGEFILLNTRPASPYAGPLHALMDRLGLDTVESGAAAEGPVRAPHPGPAEPDPPDSLVLGTACRRLAREGRRREMEAAAAAAVAGAIGPFARGLALADRGRARLVGGDAEAAVQDLRAALETWPWLPGALEALARAAELAPDPVEGSGDASGRAAALRAEIARRFPEHRWGRPADTCLTDPAAPRLR